MLDGKAPKVGVAGRTLTLLCGELMRCWVEEGLPAEEWCSAEEVTEFEVEDVEQAFECAGGRCMERIEVTDEVVEFLPRRPEARL